MKNLILVAMLFGSLAAHARGTAFVVCKWDKSSSDHGLEVSVMTGPTVGRNYLLHKEINLGGVKNKTEWVTSGPGSKLPVGSAALWETSSYILQVNMTTAPRRDGTRAGYFTRKDLASMRTYTMSCKTP